MPWKPGWKTGGGEGLTIAWKVRGAGKWRKIIRGYQRRNTGRPYLRPLVTATHIHIALFALRGRNSLFRHVALARGPDFCGNSYQAMQAIIRKYSPGLMTAVIYAGILMFALICTFAGR